MGIIDDIMPNKGGLINSYWPNETTTWLKDNKHDQVVEILHRCYKSSGVAIQNSDVHARLNSMRKAIYEIGSLVGVENIMYMNPAKDLTDVKCSNASSISVLLDKRNNTVFHLTIGSNLNVKEKWCWSISSNIRTEVKIDDNKEKVVQEINGLLEILL